MSLSKRSVVAIAIVGVLIVSALAYVFMTSRQESAGAVAGVSQPLARYRVGEVELGIATEPATPRVGMNELIIELRDAAGNPVSGIPIDAYAEMPAMGAMPAMRAPAEVSEVAPGRYVGSMNLSMRGAWPLTVTLEDPETGTDARFQFDLATDRTGLEVAAGATPIDSAAATSTAQADDMARFRAGELEIRVATEPGTPRVGQNRLIIEVRDASGSPASDVAVTAYAEMPAMGAMAAMRAPAGLEQTAPGRFEGSVNLSMRGEWPLTVEISDAASDDRQLKFDLATDRAGLTIAAGGAPVGGDAVASDDANVITIDNRRRQMIGVELGEAAIRTLVRPIRAVGDVTYDERLLSHVTLKFDGYIGELDADYVGMQIERGQRLFTVYSPELLAAQQEYLETVRRRAGSGPENGLLRAARQRLRLWDMTVAEVEALERRGAPADYVPIYAPRNGTLVERNVAEGGAARTGQTLLTIADLSRVWIEAEVFEADLELIELGMPATVALPYLPGRRFEATVEYVYPYLEGRSRTGRVRLTLENPAGVLKPDMYAEVSLQVPLGERLSVPEEAVLVAGESRVVFVDLGGGRLKPVRIQAGRRAQGFVEVLDGLSAGDRVVTSGNFLIAAETRLKTGIEQW